MLIGGFISELRVFVHWRHMKLSLVWTTSGMEGLSGYFFGVLVNGCIRMY
jgi:hypothetical protein